jgi:uncharacterized protein YecE (DUF72 family)
MSSVRIGTSGWAYPEWRGGFYRRGLPAKAMLQAYAVEFDTAEINAPFYRLPDPALVQGWRERTPDNFLFAWKASRFITHVQRLRDCGDSLARVFERMQELGPKFGPVLFQLPPQMRIERERLAGFLDILPRERRHAIEFRHPSWYAPAILDLLRAHDVALCISDHEAAPSPWEATARHVYVRGHGTGERYCGPYHANTLRAWARRLATWRDGGRDIFCYFDNTTTGDAPEDAKRLRALLSPAG